MYSIKTDLGVSGNATVNKDLLVNGNAVFKQDVTIEGTVTFADATFTSITSTSTETSTLNVTSAATIKDVNVTGNSTLGTDATSTITVKGKPTFAEDVAVQKNISQPTTGSASLGALTADSLTVTKETTLNGDLTAADGTTAVFDDLQAKTLTVSGESAFTGKATFNDVVINGSLSGTYTVENGSFTNLTVAQQSTLNELAVSGTTILSGNITGTNSTATFNRLSLAGQNANITYSYTDPARPLDIKTTVQPYRVTSNEIITNVGDIKRLTTGDATFSDAGFIGKGISTMDYLDLTGNVTVGTNRPRLEVASGLVKLHDLEITGTVTGLSFADGTFDTITVNGVSTFKGAVILENNIAGGSTSTSTFNRYIATGANGSFTFNYSDPDRPLDIRTSLTPYLVTSQEVTSSVGTVSKLLTVGTESNVTSSGLVSKGRSTFDYLDIKGNSTEVSSKPKLQVAGKTLLEDLEITGTVSGISFDLTGQDITVNSLSSDTSVTAATVSAEKLDVTDSAQTSTFAGDVTVTGQTTTIKDLVVTGTTTGVTVEANVDGLDIKPASVEATGSVTAQDATLGGLVVNGVATGTGGNAIIVSGVTTAGKITSTGSGVALDVTNNAHIGGVLTVDGNAALGGTSGTTTVHDLVVTGTTTGINFDPTGLDISVKSVTADEAVTSATMSTGKIDVTDAGQASTFAGDVTVTGQTTTIKDLVVTGTTTGVSVVADVDGLDIKPASVESVGVVTGTNLTASGTVTGASVTASGTVKGNVLDITTNGTVGGNLTVTGTLTAGTIDLSAANINTNGLTTVETVDVGTDLTVGGTATVNGDAHFKTNVVVDGSFESGPATVTDIQASGTVQSNALNVTTDGEISGNLNVVGTLTAGSIDLGATDINSNSLTTVAGVNVGSDLTVTGVVTGTLKTTNVTASGTLGVTGASTLAAVTATDISASDLDLAGTLDVTGAASFNGNITSSNATVAIAKNTAITGNLDVSGTLTAGTIDLAGTALNAASLDTTGNAHIGGDLTVDGTFDLSGQDVAAASFSSTGDTTVGADLVLTTGVVTGAPKISGNTTMAGTLSVTGTTILSTVSTSGLASLNSVNVSGTATLGATTVASLSSQGNISMLGTSSLADFYSARVSAGGKLVVGTGTADAGVIAHIKGAAAIDGNLTVAGTINGSVNLDGQTIKPLAIEAQTTIQASGDISTTTSVNAGVVVAGTTAHAAANVMQVNGNVLCNGDFVVTAPGKIVGQLDMSTSVVDVAGINSTGKVQTATLETSGLATLASLSVTGTSSFTGKLTAAEAEITTLTTSGVATLSGGAAVAGTTSTISSGTLTVSSPVVNFTSAAVTTFAGAVKHTGTVEMEDVTITGTLNTDIADLVTNSVSTKKYTVKAAERTGITGSAVPGTLSNVESWTLSGATTLDTMIGSVVTAGNAGSWFLYVQPAGFGLTFGAGYATPLGTFNSTAGVTNVIQLIYSGFGSVIDVFITQRA